MAWGIAMCAPSLVIAVVKLTLGLQDAYGLNNDVRTRILIFIYFADKFPQIPSADRCQNDLRSSRGWFIPRCNLVVSKRLCIHYARDKQHQSFHVVPQA